MLTNCDCEYHAHVSDELWPKIWQITIDLGLHHLFAPYESRNSNWYFKAGGAIEQASEFSRRWAAIEPKDETTVNPSFFGRIKQFFSLRFSLCSHRQSIDFFKGMIMSRNTDEILELLAHVPTEEKNSVKKLFDSLLKVAIRAESGYGYKDGVTGYTNGIYLAYLQTFYTSKAKKLELVAQLRVGRDITGAIDKNILLVAAMNDDEQNEAKNIWKNIAIGTMKNLGNGYRYGTAYAINHRVLNYLELYCGVNMSKSPREVFQMPGFDLRIGA